MGTTRLEENNETHDKKDGIENVVDTAREGGNENERERETIDE